MNEEKVSQPSVEEFMRGIKHDSHESSYAWVFLAGLILGRRGRRYD